MTLIDGLLVTLKGRNGTCHEESINPRAIDYSDPQHQITFAGLLVSSRPGEQVKICFTFGPDFDLHNQAGVRVRFRYHRETESKSYYDKYCTQEWYIAKDDLLGTHEFDSGEVFEKLERSPQRLKLAMPTPEVGWENKRSRWLCDALYWPARGSIIVMVERGAIEHQLRSGTKFRAKEPAKGLEENGGSKATRAEDFLHGRCAADRYHFEYRNVNPIHFNRYRLEAHGDSLPSASEGVHIMSKVLRKPHPALRDRSPVSQRRSETELIPRVSGRANPKLKRRPPPNSDGTAKGKEMQQQGRSRKRAKKSDELTKTRKCKEQGLGDMSVHDRDDEELLPGMGYLLIKKEAHVKGEPTDQQQLDPSPSQPRPASSSPANANAANGNSNTTAQRPGEAQDGATQTGDANNHEAQATQPPTIEAPQPATPAQQRNGNTGAANGTDIRESIDNMRARKEYLELKMKLMEMGE